LGFLFFGLEHRHAIYQVSSTPAVVSLLLPVAPGSRCVMSRLCQLALPFEVIGLCLLGLAIRLNCCLFGGNHAAGSLFPYGRQ
jgi:hypothetical protein